MSFPITAFPAFLRDQALSQPHSATVNSEAKDLEKQIKEIVKQQQELAEKQATLGRQATLLLGRINRMIRPSTDPSSPLLIENAFKEPPKLNWKTHCGISIFFAACLFSVIAAGYVLLRFKHSTE